MRRRTLALILALALAIPLVSAQATVAISRDQAQQLADWLEFGGGIAIMVGFFSLIWTLINGIGGGDDGSGGSGGLGGLFGKNNDTTLEPERESHISDEELARRDAESEDDETEELPTGTGRIKIIVKNAAASDRTPDMGKSVVNAKVTLIGGNNETTARTGRKGVSLFKKVPYGTYAVKITCENFYNAETEVAITEGSKRTSEVVLLEPSIGILNGIIFGVENGQEQPMAGAELYVNGIKWKAWNPYDGTTAIKNLVLLAKRKRTIPPITDENGEFTLVGVPKDQDLEIYAKVPTISRRKGFSAQSETKTVNIPRGQFVSQIKLTVLKVDAFDIELYVNSKKRSWGDLIRHPHAKIQDDLSVEFRFKNRNEGVRILGFAYKDVNAAINAASAGRDIKTTDFTINPFSNENRNRESFMDLQKDNDRFILDWSKILRYIPNQGPYVLGFVFMNHNGDGEQKMYPLYLNLTDYVPLKLELKNPKNLDWNGHLNTALEDLPKSENILLVKLIGGVGPYKYKVTASGKSLILISEGETSNNNLRIDWKSEGAKTLAPGNGYIIEFIVTDKYNMPADGEYKFGLKIKEDPGFEFEIVSPKNKAFIPLPSKAIWTQPTEKGKYLAQHLPWFEAKITKGHGLFNVTWKISHDSGGISGSMPTLKREVIDNFKDKPDYTLFGIGRNTVDLEVIKIVGEHPIEDSKQVKTVYITLDYTRKIKALLKKLREEIDDFKKDMDLDKRVSKDMQAELKHLEDEIKEIIQSYKENNHNSGIPSKDLVKELKDNKTYLRTIKKKLVHDINGVTKMIKDIMIYLPLSEEQKKELHKLAEDLQSFKVEKMTQLKKLGEEFNKRANYWANKKNPIKIWVTKKISDSDVSKFVNTNMDSDGLRDLFVATLKDLLIIYETISKIITELESLSGTLVN